VIFVRKLKNLAIFLLIAMILVTIPAASHAQVSYPTKDILCRSVLNDNPAVFANIKQKITRGEEIKVAFMGGSITSGAGASPISERFSTKLCTDLAVFYSINVSEINVSWGGTSSYLGVFRFDKEVLPQKPDLMIVEYAVNDWEMHSIVSYENLIIKALSNNIPVIAIFTMTDKGWNKQLFQSVVCKNYNIPAISYRDAYYPLIESDKFKWSDIAADYVHPNSNGHRLIEYLLYDYIVKSLSLELPGSYQFELAKPITERNDFVYTEIFQYNDSTAIPINNKGFKQWDNPYYFKGKGFIASDYGSSMEFKFTGNSFGIAYHTKPDRNYGKLEINIDDKYSRVINGYTQTETCPSELIAADLGQGEHSVKIRMLQGDRFEIIAFLLGK
jgi:hypothetical protein